MVKFLVSLSAVAMAAGLAVAPQVASAHPRCGWHMHWVPAHRDRMGHWVRGHCAPDRR
ncbi:MAG TPA: hypothetical protein VFB22_18050 [Candidatus Baltobacteraceae bacterium]|nr:hypothetical protein [Candidatus Baltobacteraceae bacterium]